MQLVSVVIPCYNSEDFIGEAITSALRQTWLNIEVIVVDDASFDGSKDVITTFGDKVKSIPLQTNRGAASARNSGAEAAAGEFFLFLDADDLLGPTVVAALMAAMAGSNSTIAACPFAYLILKDGGWKRATTRPRAYSAKEDQLLEWLEGGWTPPSALLWPRSLFKSVNGWNESLTRNDDGDIVMRAMSRGARIVKATDEAEVLYRRHRGARESLSTQRSSRGHLRSGIQVLVDLANDLGRDGRLTSYSKAIAEELAELVLLSFRAGFADLACQTAHIAKRVERSRSGERWAPIVFDSSAAHRGQTENDRAYAVTLRARGQIRRRVKRALRAFRAREVSP